MNREQLEEHRTAVAARHTSIIALTDDIAAAAPDIESLDHRSDAFAEALFLRAFTAYEADVERLFYHYVTGGVSLQGKQARTYLQVDDEVLAKKITKRGAKFLNWSRPSQIKETAETYIRDGWPIVSMMATKTQELSDCERIRNRIAHSSLEAIQEFNTVQRNMLATERLFAITPGQFLRVRNARLRSLHIIHYVNVLNNVLDALFDPPP